jgi:hypothetical protein
VASELVALDQTELRSVFKALKNMGEEANDEAKRQSGALAEFARAEVIKLLAGVITLKSQAVLLRVQGLRSQAVSVRLLMDSLLRNFQVEQPLEIFGAVQNSVLISLSSSLFGQAAKVEALRAGLFIQRFAGFNLRSLLNGLNHSIRF